MANGICYQEIIKSMSIVNTDNDILLLARYYLCGWRVWDTVAFNVDDNNKWSKNKQTFVHRLRRSCFSKIANATTCEHCSITINEIWTRLFSEKKKKKKKKRISTLMSFWAKTTNKTSRFDWERGKNLCREITTHSFCVYVVWI